MRWISGSCQQYHPEHVTVENLLCWPDIDCHSTIISSWHHPPHPPCLSLMSQNWTCCWTGDPFMVHPAQSLLDMGIGLLMQKMNGWMMTFFAGNLSVNINFLTFWEFLDNLMKTFILNLSYWSAAAADSGETAGLN